MDSSSLKERGANIFEAVSLLSNKLAGLHSPEPSFELGLPSVLRDDARATDPGGVRQKLLYELDELRALLTEPALLLTPELRNPLISVHSVIRLGIAESFPRNGVSVQDLASKVDLRESVVRRLLAHCATHHIYYQDSEDFFVHTASSRMLADNDGMRKWILIGAEELIPATLKTAHALQRFPDSEEPEHSGWSVQNDIGVAVFQGLKGMPNRARVFADAMKWHAMLPGFSVDYLVDPWGSGDELTVVDVGGGLGNVARALANHRSTVRCIVEDSPEVVAMGQEGLPADLQDRVSFKAHDFFHEQQVLGADVYLLRLVLHDWSDKYARLIIKALIPALKPGARIVINDRVIPARNQVHYLAEREARDYDMYMLAFQNAKERTVDDWTSLFIEADPRFKVSRTEQPPRGALALVEVEWTG